MKTKILFLIAIVSLFTACTPKQQMDNVLNNAENKKMVFNEIAKDPILMREFLNVAKDNENAQSLMMDDPEIVNLLLDNDGVVQLLNNNPTAKTNILKLLSADSSNQEVLLQNANSNFAYKTMLQKLNEKGILSNECLTEALSKTKN